MKTKIKNLLLLLLLLGLPGVVEAQVNYAVSGNTAYVASSPNASGNVVITNIYDGYPVTSIGDYAFEVCTNLTSVTIPGSITSIGEYAFEDDYSLTSVTIPNSVTSIGIEAFGGCPSLTSITVDASNPAYSSMNGVLFDKAQATLLQFPGGLGGSYTIPNSVTNIGDSAFVGCTSLTSVTIPNSVTSIGEGAFDSCTHLTSITVDASNPAYSSMNGVLFDKAQATLLQFPGGLGGSYTIPNSVTSIGAFAFDDCTSLTIVIIPNSVTSIGAFAFDRCYILTSVTIPNSVTSIGSYAFYNCTNLTSVIIGNGVTSIGAYVFYRCTSLTSVTIPNSVTSIGNYAFVGCTSLTSVTIPNSVTSIGSETFGGCPSLTSVTIPNSVTSIGSYAFYNCTNLTSVYFQGNSPSPTNDSTVFSSAPATVYYLPGTTGWGAMFDGRPTAPWFLPNPLILNHSASFGVQPGGFGFTISWATNASVVVEAATNLANPVWIPVSTSPLSSGTSYFSDPQWTNYPERFYRATSAFTVGGTLTGLRAGDTVTLQDNGSDNLTLSNDGTFTFPTALPDGHAYSVTVSALTGLTPPQCTLMNGSGTISGANVTNVAVQCARCPAFTGDKDLDMYNAAISDGTANGGVPGVMFTVNGGPFRVTARGFCSDNVAIAYSGWAVVTQVIGSNSCSSTTFPSGTTVLQFGGALLCGPGSFYEY